MRVSKKEIKNQRVIIDLLTKSPVGRLGTNGHDGYPRIKPLNFVYLGGRIYFHSAIEGEKIEDIKRDNRVCFEVDLPFGYVKTGGIPCKADYLYRSIIIKGSARIIEEKEEKLPALKGLMEKYQPEGGYGLFPEDRLIKTAVVRIDIEEMIGKEDLGKPEERDVLLKYLSTKKDSMDRLWFER